MKRLYKILLSILSGLLLSAAWPERGFPVLLFFAFVPLFVVEYERGWGNDWAVVGLALSPII